MQISKAGWSPILLAQLEKVKMTCLVIFKYSNINYYTDDLSLSSVMYIHSVKDIDAKSTTSTNIIKQMFGQHECLRKDS